MFDQRKYVNEYQKNYYKTIKFRVRKDDKIILNKIENTKNINKYIYELIKKDIYENVKYNFINDDIKIDFELSKTMKDLINKVEEADLLDDYGLYINLADAIDTQAKLESSHHIITNSQWNKLNRRYPL